MSHSPSRPAAEDPRPLTGEPLSVDLLNTRWVDDAGRHDLLENTAGLEVWLRSAGLTGRAPADEPARAALLETRAALLTLVDGAPSPDATDALNGVLAHGAVHRRLGPGGPEARPETDRPHWLPAWLAAADYLALLGARPDRIKLCANPQCILHFYDTTKNGARRWCTMAVCGNRAKVASHYARGKARAGRPGPGPDAGAGPGAG